MIMWIWIVFGVWAIVLSISGIVLSALEDRKHRIEFERLCDKMDGIAKNCNELQI